jgi:hypothetical protein
VATYTERATEIAERIRLLPGAGVVHERTRYRLSWEEFIEAFRDPVSERIRGWQLVRRKAEEGDAATHDIETWHLLAFVGVEDAAGTALMIQEDVDALRASFAADPALSFGVVARPPRLLDVEERYFGDSVLCHCADVELVVVVR